jgi:glycosyltransferase 2 family protein
MLFQRLYFRIQITALCNNQLIPSRLKVFLKYLVSLLVAAALLWYVYKDIEISEMISRLASVNYSWFILSISLSLLSHVFRAYRWNILLSPFNFNLSTSRTFLAVMVGYFANLLIPRMGEVTKCGILHKMEKVPVTTSMGTVVTERFVDMLCLMTLIGATLFLEYDRLSPFFLSFFQSRFDSFEVSSGVFWMTFIFILAGGLFGFLLLRRLKFFKRFKSNTFYQKTEGLIKQLFEGILSIRKIKNKGGFIVSTVMIWVLYFLMSFVVFFSMPQTSGLGLLAGLSILIMGGIGMSAPVQGGIGTFHILVSSVLVLYGVAEEDGVFFATILHTSQLLMVILTGSISLFLSLLISKKGRETFKENA